MPFTTTRTFPTTCIMQNLSVVYEYERLDRKAKEAAEFIRTNRHTTEMHHDCRKAQRRLDSWMAKIDALLRACDADQRKKLLALTNLNAAAFDYL